MKLIQEMKNKWFTLSGCRASSAQHVAVHLVLALLSVQASAEFIDGCDGTVYDTTTGLMWDKGPGTFGSRPAMPWHEAVDYCRSFSSGGYDDWRMPTADELMTLWDTTYSPHFDPIFKGSPSTFYWTNTKVDESEDERVWGIRFGEYIGKRSLLYVQFTDGEYPEHVFRPVRNGVPPKLDHFTFTSVTGGSPKIAGSPFTIRIEARMKNGCVYPSFDQTASLSVVDGIGDPVSITPSHISFEKGKADAEVILDGETGRSDTVRIRISASGVTGQSDLFYVVRLKPFKLTVQKPGYFPFITEYEFPLPLPEEIRIDGTVTDESTGAAIHQAEVELWWLSTLNKVSYSTSLSGSYSLEMDLSVGTEPRVKKVEDIKLQPGFGVINGIVQGEDGSPVPGKRFRYWDFTECGHEGPCPDETWDTGTFTSDETGRFAIETRQATCCVRIASLFYLGEDFIGFSQRFDASNRSKAPELDATITLMRKNETRIGIVMLTRGTVEAGRIGYSGWEEIHPGYVLHEGYRIRILDKRSHAHIYLADKGIVRVKPLTEFGFPSTKPKTIIDLIKGLLFLDVKKGEQFEVKTTSAINGVKGTQFSCEILDDGQRIQVADGSVEVRPMESPDTVVLVNENERLVVRGTNTEKTLLTENESQALAEEFSDEGHSIYATTTEDSNGGEPDTDGNASGADKPLIQSQPSHMEVVAGEAVTFRVEATGTAPLSYQWHRDGTPIENATESSYRIDSVELSHAGLYTAKVSNEAGEVTSQGSRLVVFSNEPDAGEVQLIYYENFDSIPEGALPSGWSQANFTTPDTSGFDLDDPDSEAYEGWVVIDRGRLDGNPFSKQRLEVAPDQERFGQPVSSLANGRIAYAESDNRSGSQIQYLTTPDYDLSGVRQVTLGFNSIYEQNQDSIGAVEYSLDQGSSWLPVIYMIDEDDIERDSNDQVDAVLTLQKSHTDVASYTDVNTGQEIGGTYGAFVGAPVTVELAPFISGRVNDDSEESKRVETFRLEPADAEKAARFRFLQAGTSSWYFGIDEFAIYGVTGVRPGQPPTISSIDDQSIEEGTTTGPINFTVTDNETAAASLTVTRISSNANLTPTSNIELGGSGANRTVRITPVAGQAGTATITVTVTDADGMKAESSFVLNVTPTVNPPQITTQPQSQTVSTGETVVLEVKATGSAPLSYRWFQGETSLNNTLPILELGNVSLDQAGEYTVTVFNSAGEVESQVAVLVVNPSDGGGGGSSTPSRIYFEDFESTAEGQLPTGWSEDNFTTSSNQGFDLGDPDSAAYEGWVVIDRGRLDDDPFNDRRLKVAPGQELFGEPVASLANGNIAYAESDNRSGDQVQELYTPDYDLEGVSEVRLVFNSIYEQNQDSMGAVEYSIDRGANWLPVVYMIDENDIIRNANGQVDAVKTLREPRSDVASYTDPQSGESKGGSYGAFIEAQIGPELESFISGRVDDDSEESKRVEQFRLEPADGQGTVRFRFLQAGTSSWYFGIDEFAIYGVTGTSPGQPPTISTIDDQGIEEGTTTGPINFTVNDNETAAASLTVTRISSNTNLTPTSNIELGGSGANRTVKITPVAGQTGTATITVTVTDADGMQAESSFVLNVTPTVNPPQITTQPQSQTVSAGETVVLEVKATGSEPLSFQWFHNGQAGSVGTLSTLQLSEVTEGDAGEYTVIVSNEAGQVESQPAVLTVRQRPSDGPFALRHLPSDYLGGSPLNVRIEVSPPNQASAYVLEEQPPAGWTVDTINSAGIYDTLNGKIKWTFLDGQARSLSYQVTPPQNAQGTVTFSGLVSFAGAENQEIAGDLSLTTTATPSPPQISIAIDASGNIALTFEGLLHSASDVAGPYAEVPGAASPLTITPTAASQFYKAVRP